MAPSADLEHAQLHWRENASSVGSSSSGSNRECTPYNITCLGRPERSESVVPPWMDWVETGIEFFGCEGESGKSILRRAMTLQHSIGKQATPREERDYVKLHEQFFESLLKEQLTSGDNKDSVVPGLAPCDSLDESITSGVSSASGVSSGSSVTYDSQSVSSTKTHKRRRPLKLSPKRKHHARIAPIEAYNRMYNPALTTGQISLQKIREKNLDPPITFLHPHCRLQKDKGKGEALGKQISAEGAENCLEKLREKMSIVMQVSGEKSGIKRRPAKISANAPTYIETRSMIELRLGFLSMQYGLLVQWDCQRTGKIKFMALRKMCHDSFYSKIKNIEAPKTTTAAPTAYQQIEAPPLVVKHMLGHAAIYQRAPGTEVVLVDPPFRVPQPEVFAPSVLAVAIDSISGLAKKSLWTISMTFNGHTEMTSLLYLPEKKHFVAKRSPMRWEMTPRTSFDNAGLEIRIFEQHKRKHSSSRLVSTMTMPLGGLVAQPSTQNSTSWQLTMPVNKDSTLNLSLVHQSEYAHWLYKELDARRPEEVIVETPPRVKRTFRRNSTLPSIDKSIQKDDYWDWLCGACFREICL